MPSVKKIPYYTMETSLNPFSKKTWEGHYGNQGCVPLNTQQEVSMERLAPGEPPPPPKPKPPKPTAEHIKAQQAEEARQHSLEQQAKKQQQTKAKEEAKDPEELDAEECEKPPVFDLQDIPKAMEKIGWPISAKCARKWLSSPKHVYNDKPNSVQPIDDAIITLDWSLKFGNVREKYEKLLSTLIYEDDAIFLAKKYVKRRLSELFINQGSVNFNFNTRDETKDLLRFHVDWQFQFIKITSWDTMDGLYLTDLTGSLANFGIYVAIGNVNVTAERYFKYGKKERTKAYCMDPAVEITQVYVYIKDNYSFNDSGGGSQYLGHWNKRGVITTPGGLISQMTNSKYYHTDFGNSRKVEFDWNSMVKEINKPVDIRKGIIRKLRESDVYFPIYNRHYNQWREMHNRGGDFMLYSKPKYMKLKMPIKFKLDTICGSAEEM